MPCLGGEDIPIASPIPTMKLYVREDVLEDYTGGIAFALASSAEEAKHTLIEAGIGDWHWDGIKLCSVEPQVFRSFKFVWGGHGDPLSM